MGFLFEEGGDLGVDGGGGEGGVAEEDLDSFEVHAIFEPVGGDGMADGVWGDFASEAAAF